MQGNDSTTPRLRETVSIRYDRFIYLTNDIPNDTHGWDWVTTLDLVQLSLTWISIEFYQIRRLSYTSEVN